MPDQYPTSLAGQRHTRALVHGLVALQLAQPFLAVAQAAELTPVTAGVRLDQAANGVPIVNIAAPNGAGVSHNQYSAFNVGSAGLILNNSAQPVNTQLGGYITGNARLGAGRARLILNEVTSAAPTQLNGYMEVAGRRAGVVVANPAGITCDGCGFINTSQATLSTGTPRWNGDGSLAGFDVANGTLRIDGLGLNATNTDGLALYARLLELNADLYATQLNVAVGTNRIDAATGTATAIVGTGPAPLYAIDSSALGGMYADTIRLVGTEAGVGMRLAGPVAALTGALQVLANGDVRLARTSAADALAVTTTGQLQLDDATSAGGAVNLQAVGIALAGTTQLTGTDLALTGDSVALAAGSRVAARGNLRVDAGDQQLDGSMAASGRLTLAGASIHQGGALASGNGLVVTADNFSNAGSIDVAGGSATLKVADLFRNAGATLRHGGDRLTITALTVDNQGGEIASDGRLDITASGTDLLDNRGGRLQGNDGVDLTAAGQDNTDGEVLSNGDISLTLNAGTLANAGGLVETTGAVSVAAAGLVNALGTLRAGDALTLMLPSFQRSASGGVLEAGRLLAIHAADSLVVDGDALTTPGSVLLDAGGSVRIDGRLVSGSDTTIVAPALTLGDTAVVASQAGLLVQADRIANEGVLFGRRSIALQLRDALTMGAADTYRGAALLSKGDISITRADGGKIGSVDNYGGLIESSGGNILLKADRVLNTNIGWSIAAPKDLDAQYEYTISEYSYNTYHYCCSRYGEDTPTSQIKTVVTHNDFASKGHAGQILARGDITLDVGDLFNDHSTISAQGLLDITANSVRNEGTTLVDVITKERATRWHICEYDSWGDLDCWGQQWATLVSHEDGDSTTLPAILEGGIDALIHGTVVNGTPEHRGNTVVGDEAAFAGLAVTPADLPPPGNLSLGIADPTAFPGFQLPNNGLFILASDPTHPYLVETDPALNTYPGFLGSGYLLERLEDWAPGITQRRLGDGYYEITLVRDALLASLGTRFLDPAVLDEKTQFEYLMNNAIAASESLHLSPGIALSREQIDALQTDIVWMEERVVAGQKVLVPVVYLAQGSSRLLKDGSVISGGALSISGDSVSNAGLLRARDRITVDTTGLLANLGGNISAGGDVSLRSGADIVNESGRISGANVALVADGDIVHRTWTAQEEVGSAASGSSSTVAGATASVEASGDMIQAAGGTLQLTAARVAGANVTLAAGEGIVIDTAETRQGYQFTLPEWQQAEEYVHHLQTEVAALQELRLMTAGNIVATAAWLKGGSVALDAGGDILLAAATDTAHRELHTQHDGFSTDSSSDEVYDAQRQLGTQIVASGDPGAGLGNVSLAAHGGSLTLMASTVAARGDISASAGQDINVVSGIDTESYSLTTSREGLTRFRNHQEGYVEQTLAQAGFSAGGDVGLDSNGSINLAGAGLQSGGLLRLGSATVATGADGSALRDADGRLVLDRGNVDNIHDVAVTLNNKSWNETQTGYTGPMEELINIGALLASNFNFILTGGQAKLPEISTGSRSSTRSESQVAATSSLVGRDILLSAQHSVELQGTALMATGLPDANGEFTGGNVNILARDIALTAAASVTRESESTSQQTTQSLGASTSRGEFQVGGVQIDDRTRTVTTTATTHQGVGIQAANISLVADDTVGLEAAALSADKDAGQIVIDARDIHIDGVQDTVVTATEERVDSKSLTVGVRNAFVDAALAADALVKGAEAVKAAKDALDDAKARVAAGTLAEEALGDYERNLAAATAQMAYLELAMGAAAAAGVATTGTGGFYVSGSAQESSTSTITTQQSGLWRGSSLAANDVRLTALEELRLTGASVTANTGVLDAARIELLAGTNTSSQSSTTTTSQQGMTASSSGAALGSIGVNAGSSHASSDATSTQYVNSRLAIGNLTSTSDSLHLAGAVIEADRAAITTGTLTITSLQDTYSSHNSSENHSAGIGFGAKGIAGVSSLSAAMGEGSGYARSRLTGEQSGIIVHDGDASRITADHTVLTGGLIANATRDADGQLVDQGRLNFVTGTLETQDLVDSSESDQRGFNFGVSLNLSSSQAQKAGTTDAAKASSAAAGGTGGKAADAASRWQPGTLNIGATHTGHRMEGMTLASIGAGNVQVLSDVDSGQDSLAGVNRDIANTRIVTLDQDTHGLNASASVDLRLFTPSGRAEIAEEQKHLGRNYQLMGKTMGEGVHEGIETAVMQFDSSEKGRVLAAKIESWVGFLGVFPTTLNNGGLAFGETPVLLKAKDIDQRQMVAASRDGAYMKAHPELGWTPISETEGFYLLSAERREELKNFMVATVSGEQIAGDHSLATYQNVTTGMMNPEALALYNAFTQTGTNMRSEDAAFTLNYNPTRHILADGLESFVDKVATSNIFGLLDTTRPFSFLGTSVAEETGDFLNSVAMARGDAGTNLVCHSQGCLLTYSGMLAERGFYMADKSDVEGRLNISLNMYGTPVNNVAIDKYLKANDMLLSSSTVHENDYVGEALGGNFGTYTATGDGIGKSLMENSQASFLVDIVTNLNFSNMKALFGDNSPHSTYQCTANCTNQRP